MTLKTTENDFSKNVKDYLDRASDEDETVVIARSQNRSVLVISQEKFDALLTMVNANDSSLDYAIVRDKLINMHTLADDPVVQPDNTYWNKFKEDMEYKGKQKDCNEHVHG